MAWSRVEWRYPDRCAPQDFEEISFERHDMARESTRCVGKSVAPNSNSLSGVSHYLDPHLAAPRAECPARRLELTAKVPYLKSLLGRLGSKFAGSKFAVW